jgi:hypothetical protein
MFMVSYIMFIVVQVTRQLYDEMHDHILALHVYVFEDMVQSMIHKQRSSNAILPWRHTILPYFSKIWGKKMPYFAIHFGSFCHRYFKHFKGKIKTKK